MKFALRIVISLWLLFAAFAAGADPNTVLPEAVQRITMPDGVRLLLKPEAASELVAIVAFVRIPADTTPLENATGALVAQALFSAA